MGIEPPGRDGGVRRARESGPATADATRVTRAWPAVSYSRVTPASGAREGLERVRRAAARPARSATAGHRRPAGTRRSRRRRARRAASSTAGAAGRAAAGSPPGPSCVRRQAGDHLAGGGEARGRCRVLLGPRPRRRRGVALGTAHRRQVGVRGRPDRGRPPTARARRRRRVPLPANAGQRRQLGDRARERLRGGDDRVVGQDAAGGDVAACARSGRACSHSSRTTARRRGVADRVQAGDPAPRLHPRRRRRCGADGLELLRGPLGLAGDGQRARPAPRAARPAPRRRAPRTAATRTAAGGWTSRPRSAPWPAPARGRRRRPRPSPTRSRPSSRAPSSVSNTRLGFSPCSARPGRSCDAACSTHSTPTSASDSADRSGTAMGSMRAVPAPSRRSCTR